MAHRIRLDECIACGACEDVCPAGCIKEQEDGKRYVVEEVCVDCTLCVQACPVDCIDKV
ncbi:4Fe-4S dicluster domain-containing protein [Heliorestis acidaminivorans]|uniref:4Fe-4S dicluster domain-containing protein n=1 Tax=Heliorestis acidaminivorans TaxID=553427 RepID=A0A6I0F5G0_9FIRM|nr:4Fe-4S binding protein [Heliorestis acidaminivorans]KAB2954232.1 4Fe-4S dicluster domain-containing protein [Heliorestis acidaminivorans]